MGGDGASNCVKHLYSNLIATTDVSRSWTLLLRLMRSCFCINRAAAPPSMSRWKYDINGSCSELSSGEYECGLISLFATFSSRIAVGFRNIDCQWGRGRRGEGSSALSGESGCIPPPGKLGNFRASKAVDSGAL